MKRRTFLQAGLVTAIGTPVLAAIRQDRLDDAVQILASASSNGQVAAAVMHVMQREASFTKAFGTARSEDAMFLLGSISKPICMTALMTLFDKGEFELDHPVKRFLPEFTQDGRDNVTMRHLLTHVSGLPDQLPENDSLRKGHAPLAKFVDRALRTPLQFSPGSRYQYSSMGILLAARVAEVLSGTDILSLVTQSVFRPLGMQHSAQGMGAFQLGDFVPVQTEFAAVESGGGDPTAKDWDWNSPYWRKLGAPWGGTHASAPDIARYLSELLFKRSAVVKPETAQLMTSNQNPPGFTPRGLGLNVGEAAGSRGCSGKTFGHTGSTGTMAWADPQSETICVVLTSLPARAVSPHPRDLVSAKIAAAVS